ncbi:MAG: 2-octaprenylphenol hydroxylase [Gammaproteobacteria bacterium]|jgi:2-octaprenylphenol hydroxylase
MKQSQMKQSELKQNKSANSYDVIVAGAGMVGACAALSFARKGFRVALVEPSATIKKASAVDAVYDLRLSAISPTSQKFLNELGIWSAIDQNRVCDYEKMFIWHANGNAAVDFDCAQLASQSLGAIVENNQILAALHNACQLQQSIDWFLSDKITTLTENSDTTVSVKLESDTTLSADLLIASDGRGSNTRGLTDIEVMSGSYHQIAIVANVTTELPHQLTAWQKFLSTGPLAFLPLANGGSSIVWSCDTELGQAMLALGDDAFCSALSEAFDGQLGQVTSVGSRQSFPLGWHSCNQWLSHRVLLIGDAAHSVHPLAGQGVNLGFSDIALLMQLLGDLESPWHKKKLRQFERQRKSETALATHLLSGLKVLYGADNPLQNTIRDFGMQLIQSNNGIKRQLMRQAIRNMA